MKPLTLQMNYFGPFNCETETIDFEKLGGNGLFLITGKTGTGKSMIFDAICFALFGETSGGERGSDKLKSDFAAPKDVCSVVFTFSHNGDTYEVTRNPKQMIGNNRNPRLATATLMKNGANPIDGTVNVNNEIKELLGIDVKQFRQICMLSQGKFKEFLTASTKDRTTILRSILDTGKYNIYSDKLRAKLDELQEAVKVGKNSIIQHLQDVKVDDNCPDKNEFEANVSEMTQVGNTWKIDETNKLLDKIIEYDDELFRTTEEAFDKVAKEFESKNERLILAQTDNGNIEKLEKLRKQKEELDGKAAAINVKRNELSRKKAASHEIRPKFDEYNKLQGDVQKINSDIKKKNVELATAKDDHENKVQLFNEENSKTEQVDEYKARINKIEGDVSKYKERDELKERVAKLDETLLKIKGEIGELNNKKSELETKSNENKEIIEKLDGSDLKFAEEQRNNSDIWALIKDFNDLKNNDISDFEKVIIELKKSQDDYLKAEEDYNAADEDRKDKTRRYELNRAGIMASHLTEGQKCPVCGSIHHPEPAQQTRDAVSEEEVKLAEEKCKQKEDIKNQKYNVAFSANTRKETTEESLKRKILRFLNEKFFGEEASDDDYKVLVAKLFDKELVLNNAFSASETRLNTLKNDVEALNAAKQNLEGISDEIRLNNAALDKAKSDEKTHQGELIAGKTKLQGLDTLEYANLEEARKEQQKLQKTVNVITEAIEKRRIEKDKAANKETELSSSITTLEESRTQADTKCKTSLEVLARQVDASDFANLEDAKLYFTDENDINSLDKEISEYGKDVNTISALLKEFEEKTIGKTYIDISELEKKVDNLKNHKEELATSKGEIDSRRKENQRKKDKIADILPDIEEQIKQGDIYSKLYSLVAGNITGTARIKLEQYVQSVGLDRIISAANRRLMPISDNRFELIRHNAEGDNNQSFLDLDVIDHFSGKIRSVSDISGGESFNASLCLALGVSDTISGNAGGILDALFIDEGFATLDSDALDKCIDVLDSLTSGNKIVGIISHVDTLIQSIPQQILVKRLQDNSSKLELKYGA